MLSIRPSHSGRTDSLTAVRKAARMGAAAAAPAPPLLAGRPVAAVGPDAQAAEEEELLPASTVAAKLTMLRGENGERSAEGLKGICRKWSSGSRI